MDVKAPTDATVYVDGQRATLNGGSRSFLTPRLQPGQNYFYNIRAEVVRNGETQSETKRVVVRAGRVASVDFGDMSNTVARNSQPVGTPARITVQLPADAQLFVDNVPYNSSSATRSFNTPALNPGQQYSYVLRAEVVRDGQTKQDSRRVVFEAGKSVTVDFRSLDTTATASR